MNKPHDEATEDDWLQLSEEYDELTADEWKYLSAKQPIRVGDRVSTTFNSTLYQTIRTEHTVLERRVGRGSQTKVQVRITPGGRRIRTSTEWFDAAWFDAAWQALETP